VIAITNKRHVRWTDGWTDSIPERYGALFSLSAAGGFFTHPTGTLFFLKTHFKECIVLFFSNTEIIFQHFSRPIYSFLN